MKNYCAKRRDISVVHASILVLVGLFMCDIRVHEGHRGVFTEQWDSAEMRSGHLIRLPRVSRVC